MIKPTSNIAARKIFNIYLNNLLRKNFTDFYLLNSPTSINMNLPLVITPNHFSWWDGFFIDYLNSKLFKKNFHIMMLEEQLNRFKFFKYLGAYSINQQNPKSISESAAFTKQILTSENNLSVIYPQGKIEYYDSYPFFLKPGLKYFLKNINNEVNVLIISFKIQYANKQNPFIAVRFGECFSASSVISDFNHYQNSFNENLNLLDKEIFADDFIYNLFSSNDIHAF